MPTAGEVLLVSATEEAMEFPREHYKVRNSKRTINLRFSGLYLPPVQEDEVASKYLPFIMGRQVVDLTDSRLKPLLRSLMRVISITVVEKSTVNGASHNIIVT
ncbi:hypothetical protein J6590_074009 [Homalodisca vitripennis]|nr:hypothetical protein J6590_074009 [Homalodisca vitripennis]